MLSRIPMKWLSRLRHLSDEELLGYLDGELDARHAARVKRHLEGCWDCRSRVRQMEEAIEALSRWRPARLHAEMEPPPKGWREFPIRLEQLAASPVEADSTRRWMRGTRVWKLAGATAAVAALALWLPEFGGFRLSAKELIAAMIRHEAAVAASAENAVLHRTVRVSCTPPEFVPPGPSILENWHALRHRKVRREGNLKLWAKLAPVFQANAMNLEDALSAASFNNWRASLADPVDTVRKVRLEDGSAGWLLETRNPGSAGRFGITGAELLVRASDWQPVRQVLRFRSPGGDVECEFTTLRLEALSWNAIPPSVFAEREPPGRPATAMMEGTAAKPSPPAATLRSEVEALYALHRIGACRRGGFDLRRTAEGAIELRGAASTAEEAEQIASAVRGIPGLVLHIQAPGPTVAGAPVEAADRAAAAGPVPGRFPAEPALRRLLAGPDPGVVERKVAGFATAVVTLSQEAWADAWALHRLTSRLPEGALAQLDRSSRWLVEVMLREHSAALQRALGRLQDRLAPVAGEPPGASTRPAASAISPGQLSRQILDAVSRANTLSFELFTVSDTPPRDRDVREGLQELLLRVAAAREGASEFQQLVAQAGRGAGSPWTANE